MNQLFGSIVASAVASIVMASPVLANEHAAAAKKADDKTAMACQNNTCKGHAACKGFGNASCAGKNECKGHGTVKAKDEAACKKAGGTWAANK